MNKIILKDFKTKNKKQRVYSLIRYVMTLAKIAVLISIQVLLISLYNLGENWGIRMKNDLYMYLGTLNLYDSESECGSGV